MLWLTHFITKVWTSVSLGESPESPRYGSLTRDGGLSLKVCGLVLPSIVLCTTSPEFYGMGSVKICFGLGQGFHRFYMGDPGFKKKNHPLQIFLKSWTQKALKKKKNSMSSWSSVLVVSSSGFPNATFLQSDVLEPIWFCLEAILCKGDEQAKLMNNQNWTFSHNINHDWNCRILHPAFLSFLLVSRTESKI